MKLFTSFLIGTLAQSDLEDRLAVLEGQVDVNTRDLALLRYNF